jgi:hypothetical protein
MQHQSGCCRGRFVRCCVRSEPQRCRSPLGDRRLRMRPYVGRRCRCGACGARVACGPRPCGAWCARRARSVCCTRVSCQRTSGRHGRRSDGAARADTGSSAGTRGSTDSANTSDPAGSGGSVGCAAGCGRAGSGRCTPHDDGRWLWGQGRPDCATGGRCPSKRSATSTRPARAQLAARRFARTGAEKLTVSGISLPSREGTRDDYGLTRIS